jgi:transposase
MIGIPRTVRVWAYPRPADLRKGYNGLYGLVLQGLSRDPMSGDVFVFVNRRRTGCKVLLWDGTGLCIFMKRLEQGRFAALWRDGESAALALTPAELALFIEGCDLVGRHPLSPPEVTFKPIAPTDHP